MYAAMEIGPVVCRGDECKVPSIESDHTVIASAIFLARGVDHCRVAVGDDNHRNGWWIFDLKVFVRCANRNNP